MPVVSPNTPTVQVSVPVPTPVQSKPKQPAQPQPTPAPQPMGRPPVSFGGEQDQQPSPMGIPQQRRILSGVILPWSPAPTSPTQMRRKGKRTLYNRHEEVASFHAAMHENPDENTNHLVYADWLQEQGYDGLSDAVRKDGIPTIDFSDGPTTSGIGPGEFRVRHGGSRVHIYQGSATRPGRHFYWVKVGLPVEAGNLSDEAARFNSELPKQPEPPQQMGRSRKVMKYMRQEVDHQPFHRQILHDIDTSRGITSYTSPDSTSTLVYADFLEENGMPEMAKYVRDSANQMSGASGGHGNVTAIMHYPHSPTPQPLTVYLYQGNGQYMPRRGNRKPPPTLQISVKSPHPDNPQGSIAFNQDLPVEQAKEIVRRLLAEGHHAGNADKSSTLRSLMPPKPPDESPPTEGSSFSQEKLTRRKKVVRVV